MISDNLCLHALQLNNDVLYTTINIIRGGGVPFLVVLGMDRQSHIPKKHTLTGVFVVAFARAFLTNLEHVP
ncbi:unnamed protein product [Sphenostylis stenocarpa]|uniref:Uncharacterized protein n=1 Tax=Sphenostylis stenocarpa TaxID=92480 RepID=A0AA86W2G8_9FABA|nr:unnamed protein product [Sphenostylis stenocarpa]